MKKQLVIIGIIALLICVGLSVSSQNVNNSDEIKWHTIQTISGNIYNETMFFSPKFTPINIEKKEGFFLLTMYMTITNYSGNLTLKNNSPYSPTIYPEKYGEQIGIYQIDYYLPVIGKISDYPYDTYRGNISFNAPDEKDGPLNFININRNFTYSLWRLDVNGKGNQINFTFSRVQEKNSYEFLITIAWITLVINLASSILIILCYKKSKYKKNFIISFFEGGLFYSGNIVLIPFILGIVINQIIYNFPTPFNINAICLYFFAIVSTILGAMAFSFREKKKKT